VALRIFHSRETGAATYVNTSAGLPIFATPRDFMRCPTRAIEQRRTP
jgi:hypothetical protein